MEGEERGRPAARGVHGVRGRGEGWPPPRAPVPPFRPNERKVELENTHEGGGARPPGGAAVGDGEPLPGRPLHVPRRRDVRPRPHPRVPAHDARAIRVVRGERGRKGGARSRAEVVCGVGKFLHANATRLAEERGKGEPDQGPRVGVLPTR